MLAAVTFVACDKDEESVEGERNPYEDVNGSQNGNNNQTVTYNFDASGIVQNHEYVDLGLSVKWATMNVGANKFTDEGLHFAWGETQTKEAFSTSNYKFWDNSSRTYSNPSTISGTANDAATVNWGDRWRIPTIDEYEELIRECEHCYMEKNGINGVVFKGKNGNAVFFPIVDLDSEKLTYGKFWCGELENPQSQGEGIITANCFNPDHQRLPAYLYNKDVSMYIGMIEEGCLIRPVTK